MENQSEELRDLEFSQALHGKLVSAKGGILAVINKSKTAQKTAIDSYFKFWAKLSAQNENDKIDRMRYYKTLVNSYYNLSTDLYEYGWGKSFHFARFGQDESFNQSLARHENYIAHRINIQQSDKVLDVGCGVGGPAREIARFTGAKIVGLNNNDYQIERARFYTKQAGLEDLVTYKKGDFMKIPFEDNSFDKVYAIEATTHAPSLKGVYQEIFRVLKPGGTFGVYEWVMTDKFDPENKEHCETRHDIELGNGIPMLFTRAEALRDIEASGFLLMDNVDLIGTEKLSLPWYSALEGSFSNCRSLWQLLIAFRMTRLGGLITGIMLLFFEKIGLVSSGTKKVNDALCKAREGLVKGGKLKIFTPMYFMLVKKPETLQFLSSTKLHTPI